MDRGNNLLLLAKKVERAFQNWREHPSDVACQKAYEIAKSQMDIELKQFKDDSYQKHHH
jgi:hypothetical protein